MEAAQALQISPIPTGLITLSLFSPRTFVVSCGVVEAEVYLTTCGGKQIKCDIILCLLPQFFFLSFFNFLLYGLLLISSSH